MSKKPPSDPPAKKPTKKPRKTADVVKLTLVPTPDNPLAGKGAKQVHPPAEKKDKPPQADVLLEGIRRGAGRPSFVPTDHMRELVKDLAVAGLTQARIAERCGISEPTLHKYFSHELEAAVDIVMSGVVKMGLVQQALAGNVTAAIWITKTRLGWREAPQQVEMKDTTEQIAVEKRDELVSRVMTLIDNVRKREAEAAQAAPAPPQILPPDKTKH